ncbi:MAG: hypothetical protein UIM53_02935 [Acutalibacteraceae bacterium]|nr:hypothetical protein [Acutalibacteraceae bacterium]
MKTVILDKNDVNKVRDFAKKLAEAKAAEHKFDNKNEVKRNMTGLLGELACEKLLGLEITEWTIGKSQYYDHADIKKLGVGVKSVTAGEDHLIPVRNYYAQIMCYVYPETEEGTVRVDILGLATVEMLNKYQDINLVKSPYCRAKGTKTGFSKEGRDNLINFDSYDDLVEVMKK